jgi:hypothetical protein
MHLVATTFWLGLVVVAIAAAYGRKLTVYRIKGDVLLLGKEGFFKMLPQNRKQDTL